MSEAEVGEASEMLLGKQEYSPICKFSFDETDLSPNLSSMYWWRREMLARLPILSEKLLVKTEFSGDK